MIHPVFNRSQLVVRPLSERKNKVVFERDMISALHQPKEQSEENNRLIEQTLARIRMARENNRSIMLAFGAHTIKNCMAPALIELMKADWLTHLATNGAGIIHDWEIAFQGETSEDVRENVACGRFGIWEETGFYINLAIVVGAYENLGYGESVGKMIACEGLQIPETDALYETAKKCMESDPGKASAALDLVEAIRQSGLKAGFLSIPHPYKKYSVQAQAYELGIPFTGHPMFGHDIIYTHPMNHGAAIGRTALTDFLRYAQSVANLDYGVYMSVGSAVMSPMIFEKSLSMSQNLKIKEGQRMDNHYILVVDLAESDWDWQKNGEPPMNHPAYYLRYCKTFHRMGGEMHYMTSDNRDFLLSLYQKLNH
jgi:hypothetical protein